MDNNLSNANEIDSENNEFDKYFEIDNDNLLNSNEDDIDFINTYNLDKSKNEKSNSNNKTINIITEKKKHSRTNNNSDTKDIICNDNFSENESEMIPILELTDNPSKEKYIKIENKEISEKNIIINGNNSQNQNQNVTNKIDITISKRKNINNKKIILDDEDDEFLTKISNKSEMNIDNINYIKNVVNKGKLNEEKIIDNLSLSSSSDEVQIVSGEDFRKHFQEEKYGPQRRIQVIDIESKSEVPLFQYNDKLFTKKNNYQKSNKYFDNFFMDEESTNKNNIKNNNNINKDPKKYVFYSPQKEPTNRNDKKRKKFSPIPKNKYKHNKTYDKLLINRVEKEILTDLYEEYQNKKDFEQTYYYLDKIKYIINQKGVEDAMNYMDKIEPLNLRKRIIYEATFFIKEIIKKEVEFAEKNDGNLFLIKQSDDVFERNLKYIVPLSGKTNINHDNIDYRRGKSTNNIYNQRKNNSYHNINIKSKNKYGNPKFKYSDLNKNHYLCKSPQRRNNYK